MPKPPSIKPAPPKKVIQVIIEFDGEQLRVKGPGDAMLCLAMISLADAEIKERLRGHSDESTPIIVPTKRARVSYDPPPEPK